MSGAASSNFINYPVNPATYEFKLSRYPSNGAAVCQFPDHSRATYRGKFYIRLDVKGSVKQAFKMRSPIGSLSNSTLYSTRAEADSEVLSHRCVIEGLEKRGDEWYIPSSTPSAKRLKASFDQQVEATFTEIKSLRIAIEEKNALILNLERQICTAQSGLATLKACLRQAETTNDKQHIDGNDDDEAMPPSNDAYTPSKGMSCHETIAFASALMIKIRSS